MSDPKTIPRQVVIALATRLATIKVASGYRTNLGLQVFRRPRTMDEAETYLQSAAIWIVSEVPGDEIGIRCRKNSGTIQIDCAAVVSATTEDDYEATLDAMAGDLKTVIFPSLSDGIGGLVDYCRPGNIDWEYPDEGSRVCGIRMTIEIGWPERIGDPYSLLTQ